MKPLAGWCSNLLRDGLSGPSSHPEPLQRDCSCALGSEMSPMSQLYSRGSLKYWLYDQNKENYCEFSKPDKWKQTLQPVLCANVSICWWDSSNRCSLPKTSVNMNELLYFIIVRAFDQGTPSKYRKNINSQHWIRSPQPVPKGLMPPTCYFMTCFTFTLDSILKYQNCTDHFLNLTKVYFYKNVFKTCQSIQTNH